MIFRWVLTILFLLAGIGDLFCGATKRDVPQTVRGVLWGVLVYGIWHWL